MKENDFHIIGIGASAGGLQAIMDLFASLKEEPDAAIVIVQHLKRDVESQLSAILKQRTHLPVERITHGTVVKKNRVYVMPENKKLDIVNGFLYLSPRPEEEKINRAIDHFLTSLANDAKEKAIGIILSGTGSDGVEGCYAIENNGGVIVVQDPSTAHFDGMPMNSIRYDHPDYILAPSDIPALIKLIVSGKEDHSGRRKRSLSDFY